MVDTDDSGWVSWAEAARITGIPVHVIEWWKRQGRIEHRPENKTRPTLRRSSVVEFGRWYDAREVDRAERREAKLAARRAARAAERPPKPTGYLTTSEAAAKAGVTNRTVLRRAKPLGSVRAGDRWWIPVKAVQEIVRQLRDESERASADAERWVSLREAARIIGCDHSTVLTYVKTGCHRTTGRAPQPTLAQPAIRRALLRMVECDTPRLGRHVNTSNAAAVEAACRDAPGRARLATVYRRLRDGTEQSTPVEIELTWGCPRP